MVQRQRKHRQNPRTSGEGATNSNSIRTADVALAWRSWWRVRAAVSGAGGSVGCAVCAVFVPGDCVCGAPARLGPPRADRPCFRRLFRCLCSGLLSVVWLLLRSWRACLLFCWMCASCHALCGMCACLVFPVGLCLSLIADCSVVPTFSVTHSTEVQSGLAL